jgi:hypothetical protein
MSTSWLFRYCLYNFRGKIRWGHGQASTAEYNLCIFTRFSIYRCTCMHIEKHIVDNKFPRKSSSCFTSPCFTSPCFTSPCFTSPVHVLQVQSMVYKSSPWFTSPVHGLQVHGLQVQSMVYKSSPCFTSPVHGLQV